MDVAGAMVSEVRYDGKLTVTSTVLARVVVPFVAIAVMVVVPTETAVSMLVNPVGFMVATPGSLEDQAMVAPAKFPNWSIGWAVKVVQDPTVKLFVAGYTENDVRTIKGFMFMNAV